MAGAGRGEEVPPEQSYSNPPSPAVFLFMDCLLYLTPGLIFLLIALLILDSFNLELPIS